jgi:hypothetical protein
MKAISAGARVPPPESEKLNVALTSTPSNAPKAQVMPTTAADYRFAERCTSSSEGAGPGLQGTPTAAASPCPSPRGRGWWPRPSAPEDRSTAEHRSRHSRWIYGASPPSPQVEPINNDFRGPLRSALLRSRQSVDNVVEEVQGLADCAEFDCANLPRYQVASFEFQWVLRSPRVESQPFAQGPGEDR